MLTNPPLVPSKDALKILRQLAFAGSTVAAIGILTLNYHVQRRIRLAEQLLETKKQIRALSGGKNGAYMARVFQAAENGQDFSIRAMREGGTRKRCLSPPLVEESIGKELGSSSTKPSEVRTAPIREEATVMTPSAIQTHNFVRPQRLAGPTASWPVVQCEGTQVTEVPTGHAGDKALYPNTAEAAKKVKRATMAMTSAAPAHVYGRPNKVVPKIRLTLHDSVASWLGATSQSHISPGAAPPLVDPWSMSMTAGRTFQPKNVTASPVIMTVDHAGNKAFYQTGLRAARGSTGLNSLILAKDFHATTVIRHDPKGHPTAPKKAISSTDISSTWPDQPRRGTQMICPSQLIPSAAMDQAPQVMIESEASLDTFMNPSKAALTTPSAVELPDVELGSARAFARRSEHIPRHLNTYGSTTLEASAEKSHYLASQLNLSANSHSEVGEAIECEDGPLTQSVPIDGTPYQPKIYADQGISPLHRSHHAPLDKVYAAGRSDFIKRHHIHNFDGSNEEESILQSLGEEFSENEQGSPQGSPSAHREGIHEDQHHYKQEWTPFPKISPAPERSTDYLNQQQDRATERTSWPSQPLIQMCPADDTSPTSWDKEGAASTMTNEERDYLAFHIRSVLVSDGLMEGHRAWKAAANRRLRANDLATVDFLYAEFVDCGALYISPRQHLVQSLILWHFGRNKHSARAAEILFPEPKPGQNDSAEHASHHPGMDRTPYMEGRQRNLFAMRFLFTLTETTSDSGWILLNLRRVIVAARLRGVKLIEEIFAIVIRFLAANGDIRAAQALYDEMIFYHQIGATFLSRTLLLRGYARIGDWHRVEREIESLHDGAVSRSRPHGYAAMVSALLKEYATRSNVEHFQSFLINAISYWGLVPTSSVSIAAVQTYLFQRRYDLIREWMETLQVLFPQVETETSSFLYHLGDFWHRTRANCQEIEETIRAVAYRNPNTKLKFFGVNMIHDALSRDLAAKLAAVESKTSLGSHSSPSSTSGSPVFVSTKTLEDYLSSALSLAASAVSQNRAPAPEVIDLHRQATAAQRLNSFLTSIHSTEDVDRFVFPDDFKPNSANSNININTDISLERGPGPETASISHLEDSIPKILTKEFLPATNIITAAILDFYYIRSVRELPTDHAVLPWVCEKLMHLGRTVDAGNILKKVYVDKLIQQLSGVASQEGESAATAACGVDGGDGKGRRTRGGTVARFGMEFFEFWMRLAYVTRNFNRWKFVIEEVLRLSAPTPHTFLLALEEAAASPEGTNNQHVVAPQFGFAITASFVHLAHLTSYKVLHNRWWRWKFKTGKRDNQIREVRWLLAELEARRELQVGRRERLKGGHSFEG